MGWWQNFWRDPILDEINAKLDRILRREEDIMTATEDLHAAVAADTDVVSSAVTLLQGLAQKLDDAIASGNPAAIQAEVDALRANTQTLADAVAANTR